MISSRVSKAVRSRAAALAAAALLAGLSAPAAAQEGVLFKNLFNGGLFGGGGNDIEYRERPPLVVPPAMKMPKPQERVAERNPAWPNDPDVAAKRAATASILQPATEREKYRLDRNPVLSQDEIRRGRKDGAVNEAPYRPAGESALEQLIEPIIVGREVAARRSAKEDDLAVLNGGEPPRKYLSEPPAGMRRPIGTARLPRETQAPVDNRDPTNQKEFAQGLIRR